VSSLERRPNWSPVNSASGGSPTLGSSSMPPNTTDRRIQLFHALLFITKHQSTNTRILLRSFRPPSLRCVLSAPSVLSSLSLAVCVQEKTRRKAKVALGEWRSRPIALPPYRLTDLSYSVVSTYIPTYYLYPLHARVTEDNTVYIPF